MSPFPFRRPPTPAAASLLNSAAVNAGTRIREARRGRGWSSARLAEAAGVSRTLVHSVEQGNVSTIETYGRLASALGLYLELAMPDRRRHLTTPRDEDPVHAAMGEFEAAHLLKAGYEVMVDEPYQHYQFAGRADIVAFDRGSRALLHLENRTRFPNLQEAAGAFSAKRQYLATDLAPRLGVPSLASVTHVLVLLWSAEVIRTLKLRAATFRGIAPDGVTAFRAWWGGRPPTHGRSSGLVLLDPASGPRQAPFIAADDLAALRARHPDYASALTRLRARGSA